MDRKMIKNSSSLMILAWRGPQILPMNISLISLRGRVKWVWKWKVYCLSKKD